MKIAFHPAAELELNEYSQFYETEVPGLGLRFLAEAQRLSRINSRAPKSRTGNRKGFSSFCICQLPTFLHLSDRTRPYLGARHRAP